MSVRAAEKFAEGVSIYLPDSKYKVTMAYTCVYKKWKQRRLIRMKTAVRYQSRGGNTKAVAEVMANSLSVRAETVDSTINAYVDILFVGADVIFLLIMLLYQKRDISHIYIDNIIFIRYIKTKSEKNLTYN